MTKPVFLVDMDGVLADFTGWIYDRSNQFPDLPPREEAHYFADTGLGKADSARMRSLIHDSRIFRDLDVIDGAIGGLWALAEEADVWICTRPLERNLNCRDDKGAWLRRHFGPEFEKRMILTSDKSLVKGAVLLDDHPKLREVARAEWRPVVYDQPYNQWMNGEGDYDAFPHFNWNDPIEDLLQWADPARWA